MAALSPEQLAEQVESLISKGRAVGLRPDAEQYAYRPPTRLQVGPFEAWRSKTVALLRSVLPPEHTYVVDFQRATDPRSAKSTELDPSVDDRDAGVGILESFRDDVGAGLLSSIREAVAGEVFTDFLEMASHLSSEGYHHVAASLAGAVLEDGLRRCLRLRGQRATGNLESMNQIAVDKSVYSRLVGNQVKVWIAIRNAADHAQWSDVTAEQVASMLRDVPGFLGRDLGLV